MIFARFLITLESIFRIEPASISIRECDLVQAIAKYSSDAIPPTFGHLYVDDVE